MSKHNIKSGSIYLMLFAICTLMLLSSMLLNPPITILNNWLSVQTSSQRLFCDTFFVAGRGATILNASIIGFFVLAILARARMNPDGFTVACVFISLGFGMAGITFISLLPIVIGTWIYARLKGSRFKYYCNECILAFGLSPIINQIAFGYTPAFETIGQYILAIIVGLIIGAVVPAIAKQIGKTQLEYKMQYELTSLSLITLVYYAGYKSVIIDRSDAPALLPLNNVSNHNSNYWTVFIVLFVLFLIMAFLIDKNAFKTYIAEIKKKNNKDYINDFSFTSILINISLLGIFSIIYFALAGVVYNGIAFCSLFVVLAMACIKLNPIHIPFALLGLLLSSISCLYSLNAPVMVIGFGFSLGISAVYNNTSAIFTIIAGIIFNYLNIFASQLFAGLNLYTAGSMMGLSIFIIEQLYNAIYTKDEIIS